jgi:hypothetical protein
VPDNSLLAGKKRPPTRTSWRAGQPGNPRDRTPDALSWAGIVRDMSNKTPADLAAMVGGEGSELGQQLPCLPVGQPLKTLIVVRTLASLAAQPNVSMWHSLVQVEQSRDFEERLRAWEKRDSSLSLCDEMRFWDSRPGRLGVAMNDAPRRHLAGRPRRRLGMNSERLKRPLEA